MTGYRAYKGNEIESATPLQLVLLTYDALIRSLGMGRLAALEGDIAAECQNLSKASDALLELTGSLNHEVGGQMAANLAGLYTYMLRRLHEGLGSGNTDHIDEVLRLAQELRSGWETISQQSQPLRAVAAG